MKTFWQYLNEGATFGKTGLYPLGYQGVGQYPPAYMLPGSADAIYYISADERLQQCWEKEPFKIDHLKPNPIWTKKQGTKTYVAAVAKLPPGSVVPPKSFPDDPQVKRIKAKTNKCKNPEPKCLPATHVGKKAEIFGDPCPNMFKMPD